MRYRSPNTSVVKANTARAMIELTILMPCLDEAETVGECVSIAAAFLASTGIRGEVLVADNGSNDGSQSLARAAGARVIDVHTRGYGAALGAGIAAARGRFIIMGDADLSYDFSNLMPFVERLRAGDQLVMGNRFAGGIADGAMPPLHRYLGNPVLSWLGHLLFPSPVADFHCGLRGFDADAVRSLGLRTTGMEFASEMVVKATLAELRIAEVPTTLAPDGRTRPPHLRSWRDGWRHLRFLLAYSPSYLFLYPGALLVFIGLAGVVLLSTAERPMGSVTLGVNTLLYAALAAIVGFQAIWFARFLKYLGMQSGELPPDPMFEWIERVATLERTLGASVLVAAMGMAGSAYAVYLWSATGFGGLTPEDFMRLTIPSVLAVSLGVQGALSALFMFALRDGPGCKS